MAKKKERGAKSAKSPVEQLVKRLLGRAKGHKRNINNFLALAREERSKLKIIEIQIKALK